MRRGGLGRGGRGPVDVGLTRAFADHLPLVNQRLDRCPDDLSPTFDRALDAGLCAAGRLGDVFEDRVGDVVPLALKTAATSDRQPSCLGVEGQQRLGLVDVAAVGGEVTFGRSPSSSSPRRRGRVATRRRASRGSGSRRGSARPLPM